MCTQFIVFCVESGILHHVLLLLFIEVLVYHSFNIALILLMNFVFLYIRTCLFDRVVLNLFCGIDLNSFA